MQRWNALGGRQRTEVEQILDGVVAHVQQRGDQLERARRVAALLHVWAKEKQSSENNENE